MELADIAKQFAAIGLPLLGAALPIPGGAAIGQALASVIDAPSAKPADLLSVLTQNADALAKAKQFELTHQEVMLRIQVDAEIAQVQSVNATMQAETKSDHWPTYAWRPFIGFMFGLYIASWWMLPLLYNILHTKPAMLPPELTVAVGSILGISAFFRGKMQADPNINSDNRG